MRGRKKFVSGEKERERVCVYVCVLVLVCVLSLLKKENESERESGFFNLNSFCPYSLAAHQVVWSQTSYGFKDDKKKKQLQLKLAHKSICNLPLPYVYTRV